MSLLNMMDPIPYALIAYWSEQWILFQYPLAYLKDFDDCNDLAGMINGICLPYYYYPAFIQ